MGTRTPTAKLHINGDRMRLEPWNTSAPTTNVNPGDIALVNLGGVHYLYVRTDTNVWKRVLLQDLP